MAKRINTKDLALKINSLNKTIQYSSTELRDKLGVSTNYFYSILQNFFIPQGKGMYSVKSSDPIYYKNIDRVLDETRKAISKVPSPSELKTKIDAAIDLLHKEGYIILKVC